MKKGIAIHVALCLVTVLLSALVGGWAGKQAAVQAQPVASAPTETQVESLPQQTQNAEETAPETIPVSTDSVPRIAQICSAAVVNITTVEYQKGYTGSSSITTEAVSHGTGVIVRQDGYIVTCHHVVENAEQILVKLNDETEYEATLVGSDEQFDLAVIRVNAVELPVAQIGDSDAVIAGEQVIAIGNPLGTFGSSVTVGVLSAPVREITISGVPLRLMQTDAAVNPGNSGGGLFNMQGQLIGIVNAKVSATGIEGIGFAIPVNTIWNKVEAMIAGKTGTEKAYLGVSTKDATYYLESKKIACVQIVTVRDGSPAQKAGLQPGDYVIRADGRDIGSNEDLTRVIKYHAPGDEVEFQVYRDGRKLTIRVVLGTG